MKSKPGSGKVRARGEPGFDEALRRTSFSTHDSGRRPAWIHEANEVGDVVRAVKEAAARDLKVSVVSGGHSWAQNHIRDGALLIDVSRLSGMEIDVSRRRAVVGPGCLGGDLDAALARLGLFFPVAHAYSVAVTGFLLAGGLGWNCRHVGLACESVVGIDVVLADGSLVHASETENSDLFWAARGSGPGFFAVVVAFHLKLLARPRYTAVKALIFRVSHLEEVFAWADRVGPSVPNNVELQIAVGRRTPGIFAHGIELVCVALADSRREAKELLSFLYDSPIRHKASFATPLIGVPLKWIMKLAAGARYPRGYSWYTDNLWVKGSLREAIPLLRQIVDEQPDKPTHIYWMNWPAVRDRPDMAFSLEGDSYLAFYTGLKNGRSTPDEASWATRAATSLQPFAAGMQLGDENLARRPAMFMSKSHVARLEAARETYDPTRRFNGYGNVGS